jgi:hypothetical protein
MAVLRSPQYSQHVMAMTAEKLHDKGDIAEELAARDIEIAEYRELLRELLVQLCENPGIREDGNAPGHCHEVPGVWDSDNGELAGKPCAWCAVWAKAVANGLVGSNAKVSGAGTASAGLPGYAGDNQERKDHGMV